MKPFHLSDDLFNHFQTARDTLFQVNASLHTIDTAAASAKVIAATTPVDLSVICPKIDPSTLQIQLGINLGDLTGFLTSEFENLSNQVERNVSLVNSYLVEIDDGLNQFQLYVDNAAGMLWFIPAVLFAESVLVALSMLGALLAWKGKSGRVFQRLMSYVVLPFLLLVSIASWIVVVAAAFGTMMSSGKAQSEFLHFNHKTMNLTPFLCPRFRHVHSKLEARIS